MKNWDNSDQAFSWFVGLFEADGSFNTVKGRTYLCVDLTDEDIIRQLHALFGGKMYGPLPMKNFKNGWNVKPMWQWRLHTQADVWPIIDRMYPYLSERRQERVNAARLAYELRPVKKPRASKLRIDGTRTAKAELKVV